MILAAAAARTHGSGSRAPSRCSARSTPSRLFQQFATLDLISRGRAEMVVGRGSFIDAFPLFGLSLEDYDSLFEENLDLLLNIREQRARPLVRPASARADGTGRLSAAGAEPVADLGRRRRHAEVVRPRRRARAALDGRDHRRRDAAVQAADRSLSRDRRAVRARSGSTKVGVHSLGYVAETKKEAADDFFPGYARAIESVAKERGWPPATRRAFDAQLGPEGALLIGEADEVAEKILRAQRDTRRHLAHHVPDECGLAAAGEDDARDRDDRRARGAGGEADIQEDVA